MEKSTLYNQMDLFDFSTPINVTVYLEDSDEEKNSRKQSLGERINCIQSVPDTTTIDSNEIRSDILVFIDQKIIEIRDSELKKFGTTNTHFLNTEQYDVEIIEDICNNHLQNEKEIRINNIGYPCSKDRHKNDINQKVYDTRFENKNNKNPTILNEYNEQDDANKVGMNKKNESKELLNNITSLLNNISDYLLEIIEVYNHLQNTQEKDNDINWNKKYAHFLHVKYNRFHLLYPIIATTFLPRSKNPKFIKVFITRTIHIAKIKNIFCSNRTLVELFFEMIEWTKRKKDQLESSPQNKTNNEQSSNSYCPVLRYELNKLPKSFNETNMFSEPINNYKRNIVEGSNTTCIFSSGPKGKQIRINVNSNLLNGQNKCNGNSLRTLTKEIMRDNIQEHTQPQERDTLIDFNYRVPLTEHHTSSGIPNQCQVNYVKDSLRQNCDLYNKNQTQMLTLNRVPMSNVCQNLVPSTQTENHSIYCQPQQMHNQIDTLQLSVTLNDNCLNKQHMNVTSVEGIDTQFEQAGPLITHITSLNPNVSFTTEGKCCVCGRITKQVCLGCYKIHYCSYTCQKSNWNYHMHFCNTAVNSS